MIMIFHAMKQLRVHAIRAQRLIIVGFAKGLHTMKIFRYRFKLRYHTYANRVFSTNLEKVKGCFMYFLWMVRKEHAWLLSANAVRHSKGWPV